MRLKAMTLMTAAAATVALGPSLAAVGSSAAAVSTACAQAPGVWYLYVTQKSVNYYVAAPINAQAGSHPELKSFSGNNPNGTAQFVRCTNGSNGAIAWEYVAHGTTLALSNDPGDGSRVDLDLVTSSGPNNSMWWVESGSDPYTYKNTLTGLYLRVSNQGIGQYLPVVAGAHATSWMQQHFLR
jgi:hypothetical protein